MLAVGFFANREPMGLKRDAPTARMNVRQTPLRHRVGR